MVTEDTTEKTLSVRLPTSIFRRLKQLAGSKKNLSEAVRDMIEDTSRHPLLDIQREFESDCISLEHDPHKSMSHILGTYYDNVGRISRAEISFITSAIQRNASCSTFEINESRYRDVSLMLQSIFNHLKENDVTAIDGHYLRSKLRVATTEKTEAQSIEDWLDYHISKISTKSWRGNCVDDLFRCICALMDEVWRIDEIAFRGLVQPYLPSLVTLGCRAIFSENPYIITEGRAILPRALSERREHNDFKVQIMQMDESFYCVIECPYILISADYRVFSKLCKLASYPRSAGACFVSIGNGIKLAVGEEDAFAIQDMCLDMAQMPEFAAHHKMLALAYGVAD